MILAACAPSQAELQAAALAAPDHAAAVALCERMAGAGRDTCHLEAAARFGRLQVQDCAPIADARWRGECHFQYAERLAGAGRAEEAFAECAATPYARECSYHLLREVARGVVHEDLAAAARALEPWRTVPGVGDAPRLYWKAWFRERRLGADPADPEACPEPACTVAARESYFESLRALHRADRVGFCATPPAGVAGWAATSSTQAWHAAWVADTCARDAAAAPSRGGGPPAIPPAE